MRCVKGQGVMEWLGRAQVSRGTFVCVLSLKLLGLLGAVSFLCVAPPPTIFAICMSCFLFAFPLEIGLELIQARTTQKRLLWVEVSDKYRFYYWVGCIPLPQQAMSLFRPSSAIASRRKWLNGIGESVDLSAPAWRRALLLVLT